MKIVVSVILIVCITTLFQYNVEISNYYYPDRSTVELNDAWWDFRFKLKSVLRLLLVVLPMLWFNQLLRIIMFPMLCLTAGDVISRVVFNSPDWHWTDYLLQISTIISFGALIYKYAKSRKRNIKGFN